MKTDPSRLRLLERQVPFLSEQATAVALAGVVLLAFGLAEVDAWADADGVGLAAGTILADVLAVLVALADGDALAVELALALELALAEGVALAEAEADGVAVVPEYGS